MPTDATITINGITVAALNGCLVSGETEINIRADSATKVVFVELI